MNVYSTRSRHWYLSCHLSAQLNRTERRDYEIMRVAVKVPTAHSVVLPNELQPPKWGAAVRVRL